MLVPAPPGTVTLTATVTDEGWIPLTYLWEVLPSTGVTIDDSTALVTLVHLPAATASYTARFTAASPLQGTFLSDLDSVTPLGQGGVMLVAQGIGSVGPAQAITASALFALFVAGTVDVPESQPVIGRDLSLTVDGVEYAAHPTPGVGLVVDQLSISETADQNPNTAQFTVRGVRLLDGAEVIITLDDERIFAGLILHGSVGFSDRYEVQHDQVSAVDYSWHLKRRRFTGKYVKVSVYTIAADIVSHAAGLGFSLGEVSFTETVTVDFAGSDLASALSELVGLVPGGAWRCDYFKVVTLGPFVPGAPSPLTRAHPTLTLDSVTNDFGSWISRLRVYGASVSAAADTEAHDGQVFISDATEFGVEGGQIVVTGSGYDDPEKRKTIYKTFTYARPPERWETAFSGVETRPHRDQAEPPVPIGANPPYFNASTGKWMVDGHEVCGEQISADDAARHLYVAIAMRPLVVENSRIFEGKTVGTGGTSWNYYFTYVTKFGESSWKQVQTGYFGPSGAVITKAEISYTPLGAGYITGYTSTPVLLNAQEFIAVYLPPSVDRINIYRDTPAFGQRLVGALDAIGTFGELGTHTGGQDTTWQGFQNVRPLFRAGYTPPEDGESGGTAVEQRQWLTDPPVDHNKIVGESSNSFVDSRADAELEQAQLLPGTGSPVPNVHTCGEDGGKPVPDDVYLHGVGTTWPIASGMSMTRYLDVSDGAATSILAAKLGDDGIIEGASITGPYKTASEMTAAGEAAIRMQNQRAEGVAWHSRDHATHPHKIIGVNLPGLLQGDFVIKSVTITGFQKVSCDNGMKSYPLYTATAEPRKYLSATSLLRSR